LLGQVRVQRFLYFAGFTYIALCGVLLVQEMMSRGVVAAGTQHGGAAPLPGPTANTSGEQWFAAMKPYCNPVEVEVRTRFSPPPATTEGQGYAAACFALAGKIDRARRIINDMPHSDRGAAASILFNVAHPVADAGDDLASGKMMALVLDYWPDNYMALYHAGMSEAALDQHEVAEKHLAAFLERYTVEDGFTSAARVALAKVRRANGLARVRERFRVERESAGRP
jgi:hypothetical protein